METKAKNVLLISIVNAIHTWSHCVAHWGYLRALCYEDNPVASHVSIQILRTVGTLGTRTFVPFFGITGHPGGSELAIGSHVFIEDAELRKLLKEHLNLSQWWMYKILLSLGYWKNLEFNGILTEKSESKKSVKSDKR